jgi:hypothetical protein
MSSIDKEGENPAIAKPPNWQRIPLRNIFRFPILSDSLPNGKRNTAYIIKKLVCTHPIWVAGIAKCKEIAGRAMFTPEEIRGVPKEENETVRRSAPSSLRVSLGCFSVLCDICHSFFISI